MGLKIARLYALSGNKEKAGVIPACTPQPGIHESTTAVTVKPLIALCEKHKDKAKRSLGKRDLV
ncbi:uncharacterized protein PHALS_04755 [Plasmopara halstedii]|uniref:Uncharacterized protein n=1 Tax=Plasmopara halstedii TaxID=4781 RepID=A0A0P1AYS1_PLAHL|nr:uncharacterized protein PHALS_04755 [Plasmopara halstedii]CEG47604.1 hypothetical protein PHALS_04755 [Plasmopara halstedii]|eukprot:XP_024583973.1 hypothetical protein PHALS_04755 [Plasmopara halstedii]